MKPWYVLRTHPRAEEQVGRVLAAKDIGVFLPRLKTRKLRRSGEGRWATEPLFPSYVFARLDIQSEDWLIARSAPGVSYVLGHQPHDVGTHRVPSPVPNALVESLAARVEEENAARWDRGFRAGDRVRILAGPFRSFEAVFDRQLAPSGRVQVLLAALSRIIPFEIHADDLQRLR